MKNPEIMILDQVLGGQAAREAQHAGACQDRADWNPEGAQDRDACAEVDRVGQQRLDQRHQRLAPVELLGLELRTLDQELLGQPPHQLDHGPREEHNPDDLDQLVSDPRIGAERFDLLQRQAGRENEDRVLEVAPE